MGSSPSKPPGAPRVPGVTEELPVVGDILGGKYVISKVLGQGSTSVVFAAMHSRLRKSVAIKVLLPRFTDSVEPGIRFDREARAAVQLRGPNVARVYDIDTTAGGLPYIVMEMLEGKDLADEMDARGPIPIAEAVDILLGACSAMHEAHAAGVIHRDLKPANIFLAGAAPHRVVKVLDFGISKLLDAETNVTASEVLLGTPVYMSPEQIEAAKRVDGRTDIWSLGVILYEMLASERPFDGKNTIAAIRAITSDPPKPLAPRRPDAPRELMDAVMKALEKNPADRYADVTAFAQALAPFSTAKTWHAPDLPPVGTSSATYPRAKPSAQAKKSVPLLWIALAAVVLVVLAVLAARR